jgi:predicted nicotinamide N-methyase
MHEIDDPSQPQPPFELVDGRAMYRGLAVEQRIIPVGGREFVICGLQEAADLLEDEEYARRFLEDDIAPYGMELWPAARMLGTHILAHDPGEGRTALELGCGLGLVSLAACVAGWRMITTDNEATSLRFARHNGTINRAVSERYEMLDWSAPPAGRSYERIFAADVLYQAVDLEPVLACLAALLAPGGRALIADPNRGPADLFACRAEERGFQVQQIEAVAPNHDGTLVGGRIFLVDKPAG